MLYDTIRAPTVFYRNNLRLRGHACFENTRDTSGEGWPSNGWHRVIQRILNVSVASFIRRSILDTVARLPWRVDSISRTARRLPRLRISRSPSRIRWIEIGQVVAGRRTRLERSTPDTNFPRRSIPGWRFEAKKGGHKGTIVSDFISAKLSSRESLPPRQWRRVVVTRTRPNRANNLTTRASKRPAGCFCLTEAFINQSPPALHI